MWFPRIKLLYFTNDRSIPKLMAMVVYSLIRKLQRLSVWVITETRK